MAPVFASSDMFSLVQALEFGRTGVLGIGLDGRWHCVAVALVLALSPTHGCIVRWSS
jgi:hypothetical protein